MGCSTCRREQARAAEAAKEREPLPPAWPGGRVPAVLTMRVVDTGRLIVHAIPKHLMRRPGTRGKARR